jgi:hypothetical protein
MEVEVAWVQDLLALVERLKKQIGSLPEEAAPMS